MRFGILLTEFPNQTSVAMWRVAVAMREQGQPVDLISTRSGRGRDSFRATFGDDLDRVFNAWPPKPLDLAKSLITHPRSLFRCLRYLGSLRDSSILDRGKLAVMTMASASLARHCRRRGIDHLIVHSMADAAHLVAMAKILGGCDYSLRLGGELEVYGGDHLHKVHQAHLVIAAAESNRMQVIRDLQIDERRVIQSSLGVDTRRFRPAKNRDRAHDPIRLVTVARLNPSKGHRFAIEAVHQLNHAGIACHYRIVGEGKHESKLRAQVDQLDLNDQVTFVGAANQEQVVNELSAADVFLLPSVGLGEATPVSVIEAMSCGLPVIVSRIGGTEDMVKNGCDGVLVNQAAPSEIVGAIIRLAREPKTYQAISNAARQTATTRYDCRSVADRLVSAITDRVDERVACR